MFPGVRTTLTATVGGNVSRLSVDIPEALDAKLDAYIPWGSKGVVVEELLWQLVDEADRDKGQCIYLLIAAGVQRKNRESN
jgi:hypothetical protein